MDFGQELNDKLEAWKAEHPEWKSTTSKPSTTPIACDLCLDTGWHSAGDYPPDHQDFGKAVRCECQVENDRKEAHAAMLRYCQLPPGAEEMTFERFRAGPKTKAVFQAAQQLRPERREPFLLTLFGPTGCGKTHLGIAVAHVWMSRGLPAKYAHAASLLGDLRAGYGDEHRGFENRLALYRDVPLLILDDLGAQRNTDWALEQLDSLIDHRYIEWLHTVVTTNLLPAQLPDRIADRLLDKRFGLCIGIDAPSYRRTR